MNGYDLYFNPRAWRVRIAQAAIWLFGAAIVWIAFSEGAYASAGEQVFVIVIALTMIGAMIGFVFYLRAYVVRITPGPDGWTITTLDALGETSFAFDPRTATLGETRHDFMVARLIVDNQWATLRLPGRRIPLILDVTPPARLDRDAMERVIGQSAA